MLNFKHYPFQKQLDSMDCGPACLKMIAEYYRIETNIFVLRDWCNTSRLGTNIGDIVFAAEQTGLKALVLKTTDEYLNASQPFPCILHWRENHYVVLYAIRDGRYTVADPGYGLATLSREEFIQSWLGRGEKGIALFVEPDPEGKNNTVSTPAHTRNISRQFLQFMKPHAAKTAILFLIILVASLLSLLIPRTIQYMTDHGVQEKNIHIIWKMLLFQFMLFGSLTFTNYIRNLIQAKLSTKLSISIISEFLVKLLRLPVSFFDTKNHADIYQRIDDHERVETFLSTKLVTFIFSAALLISYVVQMLFFDKYIVFSFIAFTFLSFTWFFLFLGKRKELDYRRFGLAIEERHYLNDLISGMTEIKLNNAQAVRVSQWSELQNKLYEFKLGNLKLSHLQQNGINTINQLKNIFITFLCAYWVINDKISFGVMLSISYIIGQLTIPLQEVMNFFQDYQDARTSFERLNEIQLKANENDEEKLNFPPGFSEGFEITDLSFKYAGVHNNYVLRNINLSIPKGKITAIVGTSGSGKTTLMKLLLGFYAPQHGHIRVDDIDLQKINTDDLRRQCGVVMQDGYIYSASIAQNIAMTDRDIDVTKVRRALQIACLDEFVDSLPQQHNTLLGSIGVELSGGQKQRLFIARAVYNNPRIIFFDEATNALDSNNERAIMDNLERFFEGKTVVVIAHRLSTVKNAAQIVVLEKGEIVEVGSHAGLTKNRGKYFELVKNQLELGV
ncbi:peptidase domain-containing ABC transporter [Chitinophaga filiformis]|uniref:Peptidase domain-containing ABC transporter n=1 Tax=Chitinophaga filiformis TaxID=104663 RepID=A0ABY4HS08_CHIFI|nr:peptidase domain-containing ABC transporter [Chitinophaga filiformis]UPK66558.1 peptidase domain-containing ABC transporter [Chitinophaga filiformis]